MTDPSPQDAPALDPAMMPPALGTDNYEVGDAIARGGMEQV